MMLALLLRLLVGAEEDDDPANCSIIEQANVVSGTQGLADHGSTATVKFLGELKTPEQCEAACAANSSTTDPCRSWAFYYPDSAASGGFAGSCYGRHDNVWGPHAGIDPERNHVCTAKSCKHPPLPPYSPPPAPPPPLPPVPPLPKRVLAPVDPDLHPVLYLGGVDSNGNSSSNFSLVCKFQAVAIINSYCWNARNDPGHAHCTNHSAEFEYIIAQSNALQKQCPSALTQMYLNSMMNFWWYTSMFKLFDSSQGGDVSLLLHDVKGELVRVTQDGGNPNMTVFDWGQNASREIFLSFVDTALSSGISSFFLDKASTSAKGDGTICNHICDQLTAEKAKAWSLGHRELLRQIASRPKATGPTIGNGGAG